MWIEFLYSAKEVCVEVCVEVPSFVYLFGLYMGKCKNLFSRKQHIDIKNYVKILLSDVQETSYKFNNEKLLDDRKSSSN